MEIWRLRQLRHLIAFSFDPLPYLEAAALPLENLRTLSLATNFVYSGTIVEMIPDIQKLGICYSGGKFYEGYHFDRLTHLFRLEKLKLEMRGGSFWPILSPVFPTSLKKLTLVVAGFLGEIRLTAVVGSLPNLQVLKLRNHACDGEHWENTEGEFGAPRLLLIDESNLQRWTAESSNFPVLECLMLHRCPYPSEIPSDIAEIPSLQMIEVDNLHKSLFSSAKKMQKEQWSMDNDELQVDVKSFLYALSNSEHCAWYKSFGELADRIFPFPFLTCVLRANGVADADKLLDDLSQRIPFAAFEEGGIL